MINKYLFDADFDAEKMHNPSNVNLYSIDSLGRKYAINGIAEIIDRENKVVDLGLGAAAIGTYTIKVIIRLFVASELIHFLESVN